VHTADHSITYAYIYNRNCSLYCTCIYI